MAYQTFRLILLTFFLLMIISMAKAQSDQPPAVTADGLEGDKKITISEGLKYTVGDDPTWAQPNLDETGWKLRKDISLDDWHGIAWADSAECRGRSGGSAA